MPDHTHITCSDCAEIKKMLVELKAFITSSLRQKSKWLTQQEAMGLLGCRKTKLQTLRMDGRLEWKTSGAGRNIMISRKSIENFIEQNAYNQLI